MRSIKPEFKTETNYVAAPPSGRHASRKDSEGGYLQEIETVCKYFEEALPRHCK